MMMLLVGRDVRRHVQLEHRVDELELASPFSKVWKGIETPCSI